MRNLIHELTASLGQSFMDVGEGITLRAAPNRVGFSDVRRWADAEADVPDWANRAAAQWVLEFWMNERDACDSGSLLQVDEKYTRLLKDFSMGEIIEMRNRLTQSLMEQEASRKS